MRQTRRNWLHAAALAGGGAAISTRPPQAAPIDVNPNDAARLLEIFAKRQSVRRYKMDPVPDEHVRLIVDAARRAPTCLNEQPWKFLVVRDKTKIEQMRTRTLRLLRENFEARIVKSPKTSQAERDSSLAKAVEFTSGYFTAPVYIVVLVDKRCPCGASYIFQDGVLAAGYLLVAARALGYGTVYLTDGVPEAVTREVLEIPEHYQRICMTPVGVPDTWPEPKPKKKLDELIAYEKL